MRIWRGIMSFIASLSPRAELAKSVNRCRVFSCPSWFTYRTLSSTGLSSPLQLIAAFLYYAPSSEARNFHSNPGRYTRGTFPRVINRAEKSILPRYELVFPTIISPFNLSPPPLPLCFASRNSRRAARADSAYNRSFPRWLSIDRSIGWTPSEVRFFFTPDAKRFTTREWSVI